MRILERPAPPLSHRLAGVASGVGLPGAACSRGPSGCRLPGGWTAFVAIPPTSGAAPRARERSLSSVPVACPRVAAHPAPSPSALAPWIPSGAGRCRSSGGRCRLSLAASCRGRVGVGAQPQAGPDPPSAGALGSERGGSGPRGCGERLPAPRRWRQPADGTWTSGPPPLRLRRRCCQLLAGVSRSRWGSACAPAPSRGCPEPACGAPACLEQGSCALGGGLPAFTMG